MKRKADDADLTSTQSAKKKSVNDAGDWEIKNRFRNGLFDTLALEEIRESYARSQP